MLHYYKVVPEDELYYFNLGYKYHVYDYFYDMWASRQHCKTRREVKKFLRFQNKHFLGDVRVVCIQEIPWRKWKKFTKYHIYSCNL